MVGTFYGEPTPPIRYHDPEQQPAAARLIAERVLFHRQKGDTQVGIDALLVGSSSDSGQE